VIYSSLLPNRPYDLKSFQSKFYIYKNIYSVTSIRSSLLTNRPWRRFKKILYIVKKLIFDFREKIKKHDDWNSKILVYMNFSFLGYNQWLLDWSPHRAESPPISSSLGTLQARHRGIQSSWLEDNTGVEVAEDFEPTHIIDSCFHRSRWSLHISSV